MSKFKGATLAVGTEVTDGQITDRNSAWLSQKMVQSGVEVIEHRAVPDDRKMIADALNELADKVDFLFVTGGLGPTSDDFTRDLIAQVFKCDLAYDEPSWQRIEERFAARGQKARPNQKQQCYFPRGAKILINEAGTANAFQLEIERSGRKVQIFAMPGPPAEIAVVWSAHLEELFSKLVPESERDELVMIRTLGRGEGDLAEKTEEAIKGSKLRVGYRAHVPYVEIKLWYKKSDFRDVSMYIAAVERVAEPWIVSRGDEDLADAILDRVEQGQSVVIRDSASRGFLEERLFERYRVRFKEKPKGSLVFMSSFETSFDPQSAGVSVKADLEVLLSDKPDPSQGWRLRLKNKQGVERELEVEPNPIYKPGTDRGCRFITEKTFHLIETSDLDS